MPPRLRGLILQCLSLVCCGLWPWVALAIESTSPWAFVTTNEVDLPIVIVLPQPLVPPVLRSAPGPLGVSTSTASPPTSAVLAAPSIFPAWPTRTLSGPLVSLKEWAQYTSSTPPRRIADSPQPVYEIRHRQGTVIVRVGTARVTVFGTDVTLSRPTQFVGGEPCLNRVDCEKTLFPLFWPSSTMLANTNRVVFLDPGHGGRDVGTQSLDARRYEKNLTLDWALRVKPLLESHGLRVILTRTNDVEVPLAQRVLMAEEAKASIFVSLHWNSASPHANRRGLEAYALTPPGLPSTVVRDGEDNPKLMFPNNVFDTSNTLLAWLVQRAATRNAGASDGGIQHARFMGVLRGQNRPAVLIEGGYLSHPEESRRIADASYRQKLAQGVAQAIQQFFELPDS